MKQQIIEQLKRITAEEEEILSGRDKINRSIYMRDDSERVDKNLLLEKGKLISLRVHTRFVDFPRHTHNYIEMVYMCQGQTRHHINGKPLVLHAGELLLLSQNAVQEVEAAGEHDLAVNFIILPQFFDTTIHLFGGEKNQIRDFLLDCLRGEEESTGYLHFQVADIVPVQNLIENLIWTLVHHQPNKRSINQLTMGLLFLQLVNHTETLQTSFEDDSQQLMLQVLRYIEERYRDGQLGELAEELHYDFSWLSREIRRRSGRTFTEWMQDKRMNQAVFLLKTTTMKIDEIGESIGYQNISYFHRIFRGRYGMSPRQYRCANKDTF